MKYIDLHCDTLTACAQYGGSLKDFRGQVNFEKLKKSGCAAQCFAVFTDGGGAADDFEKYLNFYKSQLAALSETAMPVKAYEDFSRCEKSGRTGAILTVENLGFIGEKLETIDRLAAEGVRMASLVWNTRNLFASPNLIFENGLPQFEKRERSGLSAFGREAVERLDFNKLLVDISHLSDGGAEEILTNRKIPVVASHSNAQAVLGVSRNLSDALIKKIADSGGVIGINFCMDFLGRPAFESVLKHINHIIKTGGEGVIAFGSDFDGIPENKDLPDCTHMPALLDFLAENGLPHRTLEKLAYKNFMRVFKEVCG